MELIILLSVMLISSVLLHVVYKREQAKEEPSNSHLEQAKQILNSTDILDKRKEFVYKFNEAENHLLNAQASCLTEFDFFEISDLRKKIDTIRKDYSN